MKASKFWSLWVVTVNWTIFVSISSSVFIPLTVSFNAVTCKPSQSARLSDTQELLQAVSHKTNAVVLVPEELVSFSSVTWRRPLTSVTEDKVVVLLSCCWAVDGLLVPVFDFEVLMLVFVEGLAGKTLYAPWNKVLWELLQPSFLYLQGLGHCLNMCLSRKQEKQSFASAKTLALYVGVFSLKTRHSHGRWLPLHTMQLEIGGDRELGCGLTLLLCCVIASNALEANFDLVTELLVSSVLSLNTVFFIKLCASVFSLNQSLKSRRVGFTQCFLTVKGDHDSFILGGSSVRQCWEAQHSLNPNRMTAS